METTMEARKGKGNLIRLICFTVLFALLFLYVSAVMLPADSDEIYGMRGFYAERRNSLDAVYIGGSICIVCWAPYTAWESNGIASYAMGCSSLGSYAVLPLVRDALDYQSPEVLVIDLRPFQYTNSEKPAIKANGFYCSCGMPLLSPNRFDLLNRTYQDSVDITPRDSLLNFYVNLSRFHYTWQRLNRYQFESAFPGGVASDTKGYLFIDKVWPIELTDYTAATGKLPVSELAERNLRELLAELKAREQKALFVVTTYREAAKERLQYNYLAEIIQDAGFAYWNANDVNDEMGMDRNTDYYNDYHTNILGAEKYTRYLAQYLQTAYALPDRRGDAAYADWQEGYAGWMERVETTKAIIQSMIDSGVSPEA